MYKQEPFSRPGSLRSLRSAPLLSTVLESTLSLSRIHPITSLELPGLDYTHCVQSQSALQQHHSELGTSLRSGIAAVTAATAGPQPQTTLKTRLGIQGSVREPKRNKAPQRVLSRKLKPHLVADTLKQYISRAQRPAKGSQEQQPNMEFLRGVYAFMQVSRSSVDYQHHGYENETAKQSQLEQQEQQQQTVATTTQSTITTTTTATTATTSTHVKTSRHFNDKENAALQEELKQRFAKQTLKQIKEEEQEMKSQQKQKQQQQQNNKIENKRQQ